jgi:hypothetical protein
VEKNCNGQNNISPGDIESNNSSNDSEQMNKLNERLNQFINNNFNYTYSSNNKNKNNNVSPTYSNKSNDNDVDMNYLINMINQCSPESNDNEENNEYIKHEEHKNDKQISALLSKILKKQQKQEKNPNNNIKTFVNNKLNNILSNSNLTEKLLLYNLISSNKSQPNNVNISDSNLYENDDLLGSFNKFFDHDTIEKYFQKEVIRFTIENFCKYLKENGYTIIKNNHEESEDIGMKKKEMICPHTDKKHYAKVVYVKLEYV